MVLRYNESRCCFGKRDGSYDSVWEGFPDNPVEVAALLETERPDRLSSEVRRVVRDVVEPGVPADEETWFFEAGAQHGE